MTKHVLLTGASSGVGRELAITLSNLGFTLSLCGKASSKIQTTLSQLKPNTPVYSDCFCLSDKDALNQFVTESKKANGEIDILINCAGLNSSRTLAHQPQWQECTQMMDINYFAPVRLVELVLPSMLTKKNGIVLNVLSTTCLYANAGIAQYTASKSALDMYTKVLRKELHASGIKVLSVYPGGINTEFRSESRPNYLNPEDVSQAIVSMLQTTGNVHVHELVIRPECESNFC